MNGNCMSMKKTNWLKETNEIEVNDAELIGAEKTTSQIFEELLLEFNIRKFSK